MGKKGKCTGHCPVPCARPWRLAAAGGAARPAGGALGPHTERGKEREKKKEEKGKREREKREREKKV